MRSPEELGSVLVRHWRNPDLREARLLASPGAFPVHLPIGAPRSTTVTTDTAVVRRHLDRWRVVEIGEVCWEDRRYRGVSEPVSVPVRWRLRSPDEWEAAIQAFAPRDEAGRTVRAELARYRALLPNVDQRFRPHFARRRAMVAGTGTTELIRAAELAASLTPGLAAGAPLRSLQLPGADTKFLERHGRLLSELLDLRFDGQVGVVGLEQFLDAAPPDGHWLLVADLDGGLLPYPAMRLTDQAISQRGLPGRYLLVVENERCLHALPPRRGTVAVLGAGRNVAWLASPTLADHAVIYWGDLDTWGLSILADARRRRRDVRPLLMDTATFDDHVDRAVPEPRLAPRPDHGLLDAELDLFDRLAGHRTGRLEQELLPADLVRRALATEPGAAIGRRPVPTRTTAVDENVK